MNRPPLSRRTLLKGLGCAVALPWLESMGSLNAWGAATPAPANVVKGAPKRMAFLYVPNGKNMADWTPKNEGTLGELPAILKPLEAFKNDFSILTGLAADGARAHGDGGGDHARALAAFLTGAHPRKTDGTDIRNGISVDQIAASRIGEHTRLPSLEIGTESGAMAGNCDSGYSCVYSSTMSWKSATTPLPKEVNPKLVFERMFGGGVAEDRLRRDARRKSLLDFIHQDTRDISQKISANDKRKLDDYFTAIRDIELRIERAAKLPEPKMPAGVTAPTGIPKDLTDHIRLMADLMVLAFQADVTRVCTFVLANEGSNRPYPFVGVNDGHHDLSHHGNDMTKKEKIREINKYHTTQLAYLLGKLKGIKEGDGTLLDHCMIAYGSANSDGNRHNHDDLPVLVAGSGGKTIKTGQHLDMKRETPIANLWTSMLDRMDVKVEAVGDSTGRLGVIDA
ncbi:DUF1552 domain-containing protein [Humisphaera borealis]|nr:DUF1552 domain-containing protein [Humisphaera borealis]